MRVANFCPNCGHALELQLSHGRERPVCAACSHIVFFDPKVAALALIVHNDEVLLVQRANDPGMGKWACPAGFVEHDEAPEDAVVRETLEETGLHVRVVALMAVFPKLDDGLADIVIVYQATVTGGKLAAADDAQDARWFGRDDLPELVFYPSITLIGERWRNNKLDLVVVD